MSSPLLSLDKGPKESIQSLFLPVDKSFQFPGIHVARIVMVVRRKRPPAFHQLNSVQRPIPQVVPPFRFRRRRERRRLVAPDASGSGEEPLLASRFQIVPDGVGVAERARPHHLEPLPEAQLRARPHPLKNLVDALHSRLGVRRRPAPVEARVSARGDRRRDGEGRVGAVEAELLLPEEGRRERRVGPEERPAPLLEIVARPAVVETVKVRHSPGSRFGKIRVKTERFFFRRLQLQFQNGTDNIVLLSSA